MTQSKYSPKRDRIESAIGLVVVAIVGFVVIVGAGGSLLDYILLWVITLVVTGVMFTPILLAKHGPLSRWRVRRKYRAKSSKNSTV